MPIGKARDYAGTFIDERQRRVILHPFEICRCVGLGLEFNRGDLLAPVFGFGLDHADGLLVHKQDIVRRTDIGIVFTDGNAGAGIEINLLLGLHLPAGLLQHRIDVVAGFLFRGLVSSRHGQPCPLPVLGCSCAVRSESSPASGNVASCLITYSRINSRRTCAADLSCALQTSMNFSRRSR